LAPSRPLAYPEQIGLILLTIIAVAAGVYLAIRVFFVG
jgi:hypothetical protein